MLRGIILVIVAVASGCTGIDNRHVPDVIEEAERHAVVTMEEDAVYSRVLRDQGEMPFVVVRHRHTSSLGELGSDRLIKNVIPELTSETLEDFIWQNRDTNRPIRFEFAGDHPLDVIDYSEVESRYPDSVQYPVFSRVGFSSNRKEALVYFEYTCPILCSRAAYYLLHRVGDRWEITLESETSRS